MNVTFADFVLASNRTEWLKSKKSPVRHLMACVLLASLVSCGGGGGDGGSGSSDGVYGSPTKRTSGTGIRIVQASLDSEPVDLKDGEKTVNHAAFMDETFYSSSKSGTQNITLERANSPGVVLASLSANLTDKVEYTLLLSGQVTHRNFTASLIEEPIVRPEKGIGRVQLINALEGSSPLLVTSDGLTLGPVPFRLASGFGDIPSGVHTFTVTNSKGGLLTTLSTEVADRGEITIVLGGSQSQGVTITRVYRDLD